MCCLAARNTLPANNERVILRFGAGQGDDGGIMDASFEWPLLGATMAIRTWIV
jgi:hypothetical protein